MFTESEKEGYLQQARDQARAAGQTNITPYLVKMAQGAGMSLAEAEKQMGYPAGTLSNGVQMQSGYLGGAAPQNLGLGGQNATIAGYNPANPGTVYDSPQRSTVTPLSAQDRDSWRARFDSQAAAQGKPVGQVMYEYAKQNNLSNDDVDRYMGYAPGTAQSWVDQNIAPAGGGGGRAAAMRAEWDKHNASQNGGGAAGGGANLGLGNGAASGGSGYMQSIGMYGAPSAQQSSASPSYPGNNQNPYLANMGADLGNQLADTWQRRMLPSIRSGAMAAGGFGGSRQGVVEANALNDLGRNFTSGLTNLYGTDWTNQQQRNLQNKGLDQSYDLGLRNNDLGFGQLDYQIHQGNFGNQLAAANFGLGVQNQLTNNNLTGVAAGTNIQNTPLDYQKYLNASNTAYGNAGGTRNGTTTS